jgi:hypothetical protein
MFSFIPLVLNTCVRADQHIALIKIVATFIRFDKSHPRFFKNVKGIAEVQRPATVNRQKHFNRRNVAVVPREVKTSKKKRDPSKTPNCVIGNVSGRGERKKESQIK